MLLCKKLEFGFFAQKTKFQFIFCIFALSTCDGHNFPSYRLCTGVCDTLGTCDIAFYALLLAASDPLLLPVEKDAI